jgi:hypothetical protein
LELSQVQLVLVLVRGWPFEQGLLTKSKEPPDSRANFAQNLFGLF